MLSSKVGKLLRPAGSGVASSTRFKGATALDVVFDYSYDGALRSLEESLQRLGLDRIDILFNHDVNRKYHGDRVGERLDEALNGACKALARMRDEGVIRAFGPALNEVDIALRFVNEANVDCIMLPGRYTLLDQSALTQLLPQCERRSISALIAGPFDSGILATGASEGAHYNYALATPEILLRVRNIEAICHDFQAPLPAAALQFALSHPVVATVVTGMRSTAEVEANLALMQTAIPSGFWAALKQRGLLHPDAPVSA